MENFIVSARKYRPSTFQSVVGQDALTKTLKSAIKSNHLAHAYLFCGPRGVGKTTCARIFAKTINCENLTSEHESCNTCESCVSFNEQRSYNIHELDAASNNSVDDIRSLIDQVRIPPQIGKYSVYIVDEVHMLSSGAFNAFLKTLEEPPSHAIFILATTEKHKIIPTILSRCQIYDFNRISVADTVKHLQFVAQSEGVNVDLNGLNVIAQKSDGGLRDALSIFDQLVSFCGNNITYQGVIDNLNVLDYEYYFRLIECFLKGDVIQSLLIFNEVLNKGFDANHFVTGLSSHLRDVLVSKDAATIQLLEVGADIGARYQKQAQDCTPDFIFSGLKICNDCDLDYRLSKNKRLLVELMLIRLCQLSDVKKKVDSGVNPIQKIIQTPISQSVTNAPLNNYETTKPIQQAFVSQQPTQQIKKTNEIAPTNFRPPSISIKTAVVASTPEPEYLIKEPEVIILNEPFTDDELEIVWNSFTDTIPENVRIVSFIQSNVPERISDTELEISVSNIMQKNELIRIQQDILKYLSVKLKNSSISLRIKVNEENESQRALSPEEKYKIMATENPALETLRKNLQLEID